MKKQQDKHIHMYIEAKYHAHIIVYNYVNPVTPTSHTHSNDDYILYERRLA